MKYFKRTSVLLLIVLLCLSIVACNRGNAESQEHEISGKDWRTTGIVRDSGKIARDGKMSDVLICVHNNDAVFYLDTKKQTAFDRVEYPMAVNNPWDEYESTDFSDRNGDGNSDVCMTFCLSDGDKLIMTWLWSADEEKYVFCADESSVLNGNEK